MYRYNIAVVFAFTLTDLAVADENHCRPKDCYDLKCYKLSTGQDGPHTIYPDTPTQTTGKVTVSCDQNTEGGGWIMYQRRVDGALSFQKNWKEYTEGFGTNGDGKTELWLGNENVYQVLQTYQAGPIRFEWEMRLEADTKDENNACWLLSQKFRMLNAANKYAIDWFWGRVGGNAFNMTEDFNHLRLRSFKTVDSPDGHSTCCNQHKGGWWYAKRYCIRMFLNGNYPNSMYIHHFGTSVPLIRSRMMFRRQDYHRFAVCDNPCQQGGTCRHIDAPRGHICTCIPNYCGSYCELTCENGGTCYYDRAKSITKCLCNSAFSGRSCETKVKLTTTTTAKTTTTTTTTKPKTKTAAATAAATTATTPVAGENATGVSVANDTVEPSPAGITGTTPGEAEKKSVLSWIMTLIIALLVMILILLISITGKEERDRRRRRVERAEEKQLRKLKESESSMFSMFGF